MSAPASAQAASEAARATRLSYFAALGALVLAVLTAWLEQAMAKSELLELYLERYPSDLDDKGNRWNLFWQVLGSPAYVADARPGASSIVSRAASADLACTG